MFTRTAFGPSFLLGSSLLKPLVHRSLIGERRQAGGGPAHGEAHLEKNTARSWNPGGGGPPNARPPPRHSGYECSRKTAPGGQRNGHRAQNNLGTALARQCRLDEAIPHLREAIRFAPNDSGSHFNPADALAWKGSLDEAIAEYRTAIKLNPTEAATYCSLGNALAGKGLLDDPITQYQQALKLNPDLADAQNNLRTALELKAGTARPTATQPHR